MVRLIGARTFSLAAHQPRVIFRAAIDALVARYPCANCVHNLRRNENERRGGLLGRDQAKAPCFSVVEGHDLLMILSDEIS
jgi:hypothetical protein